MATELMDKAKKNKADEFYTQLDDIEKELCHYTQFFKDKTVLCNCDDPYESNFINARIKVYQKQNKRQEKSIPPKLEILYNSK